MKQAGYIQKMHINHTDYAEYAVVVDQQQYPLNQYIGDFIEIEFLGDIRCMACGSNTKTSFNQGFCYRCFQTLARNDQCVMNPHLCHFAQGTCREPEWGMAHCMQPHLVYLAWSSNLKVGITKPSQIPTRWLDQGATSACIIAEVQSRYHAGLIEEYLKQYYKDRTNWRKMLAGEEEGVDMIAEAKQAQQYIEASDLAKEVLEHTHFPEPKRHAFEYPDGEIGPIKSLNLEKLGTVTGHLLGMKGQYLLLDTGVINLRKYTQYHVEMRIKSAFED